MSNNNPEFKPTGQEMHGVTFSNPAYTLIFIAVHWNGDDYSFINKPENRLDFWWSRWGQWKNILRPFTFHCFMIKSYNTKTSKSGQGSMPIKHVMEFNGIDEARAFNFYYLEQYKRWNEFADAEMASAEVIAFEHKMNEFKKERLIYNDKYLRSAEEIFLDDEFIARAAFALDAEKHELDTHEMSWDEMDEFHKSMLEALQYGITHPELLSDDRIIFES